MLPHAWNPAGRERRVWSLSRCRLWLRTKVRALASSRYLIKIALLGLCLLSAFFYLIRSHPSLPDNAKEKRLTGAPTPSVTVQVFMPIDRRRVYKNAEFCRALWSVVVNGYRVTLYNWDVIADNDDETNTHRPKVTGLASILSSTSVLQSLGILPQDLIFMVDAVDVILQLSPSVLISRYRLLNEGQQGKPVAAGSFNCWPNDPNSPACTDVPPSPMPAEMFYSDETVLKLANRARFPIHANSGLVLGSVSEMSKLFSKINATLESAEYTWPYDQGAFNLHLQSRDLTVDNTLSMFWCAEHHASTITLDWPDEDILRTLASQAKYKYPFSVSRDDLPSRRVAWDKRTSNIPVALHFNGAAKKGYNKIWEEVWPSMDAEAAGERFEAWKKEQVRVVTDDGVITRTVQQLCEIQLGL